MKKQEMINYLLSNFKKINKNSKFLLDDLREYRSFLKRKTLTELKEIFNRQIAINSINEHECRKECILKDLF